MSGWVTIWDVAAEPFRWGSAGEGLWALSVLSVGLSGAAALYRRSAAAAAAAVSVSVVAAGVVVWGSFEHVRRHDACVDASRHESGRIIEGVMREYRPLASYWQRPAEETFMIAGEVVRLPLVGEGCGYHQTSLEGGRLRDGMRVRLHSWEGQILRVEVDRDALLGVAEARPER